MKQTIVLQSHFDSAHKLPWHEGKCSNLHGHTYQVEVTFEGKLNKNGIIEDFGSLKFRLNQTSDYFDHKYLNDIIDNPTVERLAQAYWEKLKRNLFPYSVKIIKIKVSEGLNNWTELYE